MVITAYARSFNVVEKIILRRFKMGNAKGTKTNQDAVNVEITKVDCLSFGKNKTFKKCGTCEAAGKKSCNTASKLMIKAGEDKVKEDARLAALKVKEDAEKKKVADKAAVELAEKVKAARYDAYGFLKTSSNSKVAAILATVPTKMKAIKVEIGNTYYSLMAKYPEKFGKDLNKCFYVIGSPAEKLATIVAPKAAPAAATAK